MSKSVFCLSDNEFQTEKIVQDLKAGGFSNNDISVLFPDKSGTKDFAHEQHTKAPEGAVTGAGTGGIVGGALGWLMGIGALAIPGVGPFIAAGPIMAALSGAAIGATAGGITGALVGYGIPEYEAKLYAGKLEKGHILLGVHASSADKAKVAKDAFKSVKAHDIKVTSEVEAK